MLTQQDILNRLNQLTLHYNLTWRDIKYDADQAIVKINNYLGTIYPPMSDILTHSEAAYTYRSGFIDIPFIKDEYIHSVIIPYIATEVLARDEEFTTIYNKYTMQYQEGLFDMFSKEFNRVPVAFRQPVDQGVFFASDGALEPVARTLEDNLDVVQFRVYYHLNNDQIVYSDEFFTDSTLYTYQATHTVLSMPENFQTLFLYGYAQVALFQGWSRNADTSGVLIQADEIITVDSDIHLYAQWDTVSTLEVSATGVLSLVDTYANYIVDLIIPDKIGGYYVQTIPTEFKTNAVSLRSVVLPGTLKLIELEAFYGTPLESVLFDDTSNFDLTIGYQAFANTKLTSVILPTNITSIYNHAFNTPGMTIHVRYLEGNIPLGWVDGWFAPDIGIEVEYGYNG